MRVHTPVQQQLRGGGGFRNMEAEACPLTHQPTVHPTHTPIQHLKGSLTLVPSDPSSVLCLDPGSSGRVSIPKQQ